VRHCIGADAEARGADGVGQANSGTGEGRVPGNEQDRGEQIGLILHLLIPHPAAARTDGRARTVFEQEMGNLVSERVGQATVGVGRVEDDQPGGSHQDRARRERPPVDDGQLVDR
jgi:hypothetical protein